MEIKNGTFCPLIKKECIGLKCTFFIQVRGTHPQTGKEIDEWDCSIKWLPVLLIENANMTRQAGAAIESFRNETVKGTQATINALVEVSGYNERTKDTKLIEN